VSAQHLDVGEHDVLPSGCRVYVVGDEIRGGAAVAAPGLLPPGEHGKALPPGTVAAL
jgi:hypothetical protein